MTTDELLQTGATPTPSLRARLCRLLRHGWLGDNDTHRALPEADMARVTEAVAASERRHTAQIRVCVEASLPASYAWRAQTTAAISRDRALRQFAHLRVWDTEHNNGVLIYLLLAEHTIEIVSDRAVGQAVAPAEWNAIVGQMQAVLRQDAPHAVADALLQAIAAVSPSLERLFPPTPAPGQPPHGAPDTPRTPEASWGNELPDAPVLDPRQTSH